MIANDASTTQRHNTTEKISITTTPTTLQVGGNIVLTHDRREPTSSLLSRVDEFEEELDRKLAHHQFSELSLGLNATISAAEKSFKREDYIYVSFLFLFLFFSEFFKNDWRFFFSIIFILLL